MPENNLDTRNGPIREKLLKFLSESGEYKTPINGFFLFRKNECECP